MSFREKRINFINTWTIDHSMYPETLFEIEQYLIERLKSKGSLEITPLHMPNLDDRQYHIVITFIIDALRFLPLRPDLAFDSCWKGLEVVSKELTGKSNVTGSIECGTRDFWGPLYRTDQQVRASVSKLLAAAPVQTWEDVSKNLVSDVIDDYDDNGKLISGKQARHVARVIRFPDNSSLNELEKLLVDLRRRHAPVGQIDAEGQRKCALFLRKLFRNELDESRTTIRGAFTLSDEDRLHFLVSGVMYTYRNQRFHGSRPSPFFTSAATLKTYAHSYFMFLCAYSFLLIAIYLQAKVQFSANELGENISKNVDALVAFFGRHMNG